MLGSANVGRLGPRLAMATDTSVQAASSSFLGLPSEIRVMIYKLVFANLRPQTPYSIDAFEDYTSQSCFEELKSEVGLIWTSRLVRKESSPLLIGSVRVFLPCNDRLLNMPMLARKYATEVDATSHHEGFSEREQRWRPEDYYEFLSLMFPHLQHIRYSESLETCDCADIYDIICYLRGLSDEANMNSYLEAGNLECAAPAEGPEFAFTIDIPFEFDLRHGHIDYCNHVYCLYVSPPSLRANRRY